MAARSNARSVGLALALVIGGAVYFAAELDLVAGQNGDRALTLVALAVLVYLMFTVDPAWIISAGLASTLFAAHWGSLGLDSAVGPHRVLLGAGVLAVLLRLPPARDRPPLRPDIVHFALAVAVGYAFISAIFVGMLDDRYSRFALLDQFGIVPFVMFLVAPVAFATERQRRILLGTIVGIGLYLTVVALLEQMELYDVIWPRYIADPNLGIHYGRARGPFLEGGAMGVAIFTCAAASGIALAIWRSTLSRLVAAAVLVLAPVGVLLTVTRGAWAACIVATAVVLSTTAGLRRYLIPAAALVAVLVLGALAGVPGLAGQVRDRQADKNPVYERQNTNAAGVRMLRDKPFFGFGWDRPYHELEPYFLQQDTIPLVGRKAGLHNTYLQYAVALGLVGFVLWLGALGLAFTRAISTPVPATIRPWQIGLKAVVVAWIGIGLVNPAHFAFMTYVLFTWAGVAYARGAAPVPVPLPSLVTSNGSSNGYRRNGNVPVSRPQTQPG
jgi:O-antigen ligase